MMAKMMQEIFNDENHRLLSYTKIDRCQDNIYINNDEYYKQILHLNEYFNHRNEKKFNIILKNQINFILIIFLILISQTNAVPVYQSQVNYNQQPSASAPISMPQYNDNSVYPQSSSFRVYRRYQNPLEKQYYPIPNYSNGFPVQTHNQQQFLPSTEQQFALQLRRERQRRAMIDRIVLLFDEDGNGQLTKDELYSMALRLNVFPKVHHYLKQSIQ